MRTSIQLPIIFALSLAPAALAQQSPTLQTLHTQAKLVVVDVVVTDQDHHAVHDLKQQDFSIFEDRKPQIITSFEEHRALTSQQAARFTAVPALPPGTFSNFTSVPTNAAVDILLLDTLNTGPTSQMFVRNQVLEYLKNARPGANIAIFGLSDKLYMLQEFTTDPEVLKAAVSKLNAKVSPLRQDALNGGEQANREIQESTDGTSPLTGMLQSFIGVEASVEDSNRAQLTVEAMNLLGHYLSTIPGRKNLLWFAGQFPVNLLPDSNNPTDDPFLGMGSVDLEYRETARMFADGRVAVYPVDARGLISGSGGTPAAAADAKSIMLQMAYDTGGRAYLNTNGLAQAVDQVISDGSTFYTISYRPSEQSSIGKFRKTEVKLAQKGYSLDYRHGYYEDRAVDTKHPRQVADISSSTNSPIFRAMEHGVPSDPQIIFKARVLPVAIGQHPGGTPVRALRRYAVDFAVLPNDVSYATTPDGVRHFEVEFITVAYRSDGAMVNRTANYLKGSFTPAQFTALQQTGFPFHQTINVPMSGSYSLRVGIHDLLNDHIGVTEIPASSVKNLPPAAQP